MLDGLAYAICPRTKVITYYETMLSSCPNFIGSRVIISHTNLKLHLTCPGKQDEVVLVKSGTTEVQADCTVSRKLAITPINNDWGIQKPAKTPAAISPPSIK